VDYDFIFICNEHMPIDRTETAMMCQFYAAKGISPVVRIPTPQAHYAAMALDGGAQGIVVPYVETVEEVQEIVGAVKYRPLKGKKLRDYLDGTTEPSPEITAFLEKFNRNNYVIIGIESVAGYDNLDAMLAIPGVDGVFVGPHDMTVSMDIPEQYDHPEFVAMLEDILTRCKAAGVGAGVHLSQMVADDTRFTNLIEKGMNWVLYGADIALLVGEMRKRLDGFRTHMGDTYAGRQDNQVSASSCLNRTK